MFSDNACAPIRDRIAGLSLDSGPVNMGDELSLVEDFGGRRKRWYRNGKLHSEGEEPAYVLYDKDMEWVMKSWYKDGKLHREGNMPAIKWKRGHNIWLGNEDDEDDEDDEDSVIYNVGSLEWYVDGKLHRVDGPASISYGLLKWFYEGKLHREGDMAAMFTPDGSRYWYKHGKLHRDGDKPAIENSDGSRCWFSKGKLHRDGGKAAIINHDGTEEFFRCGIKLDSNGREMSP